MSITIRPPLATSALGAVGEPNQHHRLLADLRRLDSLAEVTAASHGGRHRELLDVLADLRELRDDLEPHFLREQRLLATTVGATTAVRSGTACARTVTFGVSPEVSGGPPPRDLERSVAVMQREHRAVAVALGRLRARTNGFRAPHGASARHLALYRGLAAIEIEIRELVDKENTVVFPLLIAALQDGRR